MAAVGGLTSPVKGPYTSPLYISNKPPDSLQLINSSVDFGDEEDHRGFVERLITTGRRMEKLEDDEKEEEKERGLLLCPQMLISEPNHKRSNKITTVSELELRKLERGEASLCPLSASWVQCSVLFKLTFSGLLADFYLSSLSQPQSAEMQVQLLSCLSNEAYSNWEPWDKKVNQNTQLDTAKKQCKKILKELQSLSGTTEILTNFGLGFPLFKQIPGLWPLVPESRR